MEINWTIIAKFIEQLIKEKLKEKKLIATGKLLDSIKVISTGDGGFEMEGEDYFKFLDAEHKISAEVFASTELSDFIEKEFAKAIEKSL